MGAGLSIVILSLGHQEEPGGFRDTEASERIGTMWWGEPTELKEATGSQSCA